MLVTNILMYDWDLTPFTRHRPFHGLENNSLREPGLSLLASAWANNPSALIRAC